MNGNIFSKVSGDDDVDIGRKLDKGNDLLGKLVDGQNNILMVLERIEKKL